MWGEFQDLEKTLRAKGSTEVPLVSVTRPQGRCPPPWLVVDEQPLGAGVGRPLVQKPVAPWPGPHPPNPSPHPFRPQLPQVWLGWGEMSFWGGCRIQGPAPPQGPRTSVHLVYSLRVHFLGNQSTRLAGFCEAPGHCSCPIGPLASPGPAPRCRPRLSNTRLPWPCTLLSPLSLAGLSPHPRGRCPTAQPQRALLRPACPRPAHVVSRWSSCDGPSVPEAMRPGLRCPELRIVKGAERSRGQQGEADRLAADLPPFSCSPAVWPSPDKAAASARGAGAL